MEVAQAKEAALIVKAAEGDSALAERLAPAMKASMDAALKLVEVVGPAYAEAAKFSVWAYHNLPLDMLQALTGLGLCFFGGAYCASIAAVEAFTLVGWSTTVSALEEIYEDVLLIREAHEADEKNEKKVRASQPAPVRPRAHLCARA